MRLSKEQLDFFNTFGFLKFPGLLSDRIDSITEEFEKVFPEHEMGSQHDGTKRTCVVPFIDQREKLSELLDDERIEGILASLLGEDYNYMGSDGNYYAGDTGWHRDGYHEKYLNVKIAFYLDQLEGSSGALRVIPGSHRLNDQYGSDLGHKMHKSKEIWGLEGHETPAQILNVTPGDILVFNHNLFHSSWGGGGYRRMFTINACQRYEEDDLELLRNYLSGYARFGSTGFIVKRW